MICVKNIMDSEIGRKFQSEQVIEELRKYKTKGARATAYLTKCDLLQR